MRIVKTTQSFLDDINNVLKNLEQLHTANICASDLNFTRPPFDEMHLNIFKTAQNIIKFYNFLHKITSNIDKRYEFITTNTYGDWYISRYKPVLVDGQWLCNHIKERVKESEKSGFPIAIPILQQSDLTKRAELKEITDIDYIKYWHKLIFRRTVNKGTSLPYINNGYCISPVKMTLYRGLNYSTIVNYDSPMFKNCKYLAKNKNGEYHVFFNTPRKLGDGWLPINNLCARINVYPEVPETAFVSKQYAWDRVIYKRKEDGKFYPIILNKIIENKKEEAMSKTKSNESTERNEQTKPDAFNLSNIKISINPNVKYIVISDKTCIISNGVKHVRTPIVTFFDIFNIETALPPATTLVLEQGEDGFKVLDKIPSSIPDSIIPREDFNYIAMQENGEWYLFSEVPEFKERWYRGGNSCRLSGLNLPSDLLGHKESLHIYNRKTQKWERY